MFGRHSPLAACIAAGGRDGATGSRSLQIVAVYGWQLTLVTAFRGSEPEMERWLTGLVQTDSRPAPGVTIAGLRGMVLNTAPGQYWLVTSDEAIVRELQSGVRWVPEYPNQPVASAPAIGGTATPLSHAYVRLAVCGSGWRDVLSKGISVDLHPDVLRIGDFVQTGLHHIE